MRCKPSVLAKASVIALGISVAQAAQAQSSPSSYTTGMRYDLAGRLTGTISPDPDGGGSLKHAATRNTYDSAGRLIKVEQGELSSWPGNDAPSSWGTSWVLKTIEYTYDSLGNKLTELVKGWDSTTSSFVPVSLTQYSYDPIGRLECSTVRMNPDEFASPPTSACSLDTEGSFRKDRITKNIYDDAGQLTQIRKAVGVAGLEQAYATYTYSSNGKQTSVTDANGNKATLAYDGFDRQIGWVFPSKTAAGVSASCTLTGIQEVNGVAGPTEARSSSDDCEKYAYDRNGNRRKLMKRDGTSTSHYVITYEVDALNRIIEKTVPERSGLDSTHTRDVFYSYDAKGLMTAARFGSISGEGATTAYDGFGRITSSTIDMNSVSRTQYYCYDKDGNRTRMSFPDSSTSSGNCQTSWTNYVAYTYDGLDRPLTVSGSAPSWSHTYVYNQRGALVSDSISGSGGVSTLERDPVDRLWGLRIDVAGTANDLVIGKVGTTGTAISYNPASQMMQEARSNDAYAYTARLNVSVPYTVNGLNQYTTASSVALAYDLNGNLTCDYAFVYLYDVENRLVEKRQRVGGSCTNYTGTLQARLRYDPMGRLYETDDDPSDTLPETGYDLTRYLIDGDALVAEYDVSGTMLRRYVHGANGTADDPIAWYEGTAMNSTTLRHLFADRQGSIVLTGDSAGNGLRIFAFDEYGIPTTAGGTPNLTPANGARFLYTGQVWLPEAGIFYYKGRMYSPTLGRFMQTDPIGYEDQLNLYAYVGDDPVNARDPSGLASMEFNYSGSNCFEYAGRCYGYWEAPGSQNSAPSPQAQQRSSNVVSRSVSNAGEILSNLIDEAAKRIQDNAVQGKKSEQAIEEYFNDQGWTILGRQVHIRDDNGRLRIYDYIVAGGVSSMYGIEVKSGGATRNTRQRSVDREVYANGGTVRSWIQAGLSYGQRVKFYTHEIKVRICAGRGLPNGTCAR